MRPSFGRVIPEHALNVVVLPAPFGPMSPVIRPGGRGEAQLVDRDEAAEANRDADDLESGAIGAATPSPTLPLTVAGTSGSARRTARATGSSAAAAASSAGRRPPSRSRKRWSPNGTCGGFRRQDPDEHDGEAEEDLHVRLDVVDAQHVARGRWG